jgi:hypothetical protein
VEKYRRAEEATDDNMAHVLYMLDTYAKNKHSEYAILIAVSLQK